MEYEVHCHHCDVSFPVGTRHCVHCGGRIRKGGLAPQGAVRAVPVDVFTTPEAHDVGRTDDFSELGEPVEDDDEPRASRLRLMMNGLWVVFILIAMVARYCAESS